MSVLTLTNNNFEAEVMAATTPVLVDFWADWCGPCKMMSPVVEAVAEAYPSLKVGKVNTDQNLQLSMSKNINAIPALLLFKDGKEIARTEGYRGRVDFEAWLKSNGAI